MFCPECQAEYTDGIYHCSDCDVKLVYELPEVVDEVIHDLRLVTVYVSGNPADLAVAKSILDGESIEFFAKGEGVQNLFGTGTVGTGFNLITGPVEIQVNEPDMLQAQAALQEFIDHTRKESS